MKQNKKTGNLVTPTTEKGWKTVIRKCVTLWKQSICLELHVLFLKNTLPTSNEPLSAVNDINISNTMLTRVECIIGNTKKCNYKQGT